MKHTLRSILPLILALNYSYVFADNLYVGASAVGGYFLNKKDVDLIFTGEAGLSPYNGINEQRFNDNTGDIKPEVALLLGYTFQLTNINLSLEGAVNYTFTQNKQHIDPWLSIANGPSTTYYSASVNEQLKFGWGVFLVPEIFIARNTRLFIKAGYKSVQFSSDSNDGTLGTAGPLGISGKFHKFLHGVGAGLGTNLDITNLVTFRLEYLYTYFSPFSKSSTEPAAAPASGNTGTGTEKIKYQISSGTVALSLIYNFGERNYYL